MGHDYSYTLCYAESAYPTKCLLQILFHGFVLAPSYLLKYILIQIQILRTSLSEKRPLVIHHSAGGIASPMHLHLEFVHFIAFAALHGAYESKRHAHHNKLVCQIIAAKHCTVEH